MTYSELCQAVLVDLIDHATLIGLRKAERVEFSGTGYSGVVYPDGDGVKVEIVITARPTAEDVASMGKAK